MPSPPSVVPCGCYGISRGPLQSSLVGFDQERVTFRWKDYVHGGKQGKMTFAATEFLRRFFLHVLPRGFVRIRHFGFLANRFRASRLAISRQLLSSSSSTLLEAGTYKPPAELFCLALPTLRRGDDRGSEIYRCGIIHMRLLRFFVACSTTGGPGMCSRTPAHSCAAASPPFLRPLSAYTLAHLQHHSDKPGGVPPTLRCSPQAPFRSTLPFKSHSAPRPPQTPAASS